MWTLSQAALDVLAERRGQVEREGWTSEHDDQHSVEELQKAGVAYASIGVCALPSIFWPWGRDWWKPKGLRQNLVRGAALLIAAIERLDRQQTANVGGEAHAHERD